jgi:hypothetical protein
MFEMIKGPTEDRKLRLMKTVGCIVAVAIMGALVLFFAFAPYS